ncbi:hypothetical protein GCM10010145_45830 [Streptomyces ruber]|uniref:Uncharacterized protein n=2 Tax=Streptomyces TaxID=1883 RepID=A0A918EW94_9ACTN|nr:hypothetical protein GCM10010145_45830 [Streptomyces ruber]
MWGKGTPRYRVAARPGETREAVAYAQGRTPDEKTVTAGSTTTAPRTTRTRDGERAAREGDVRR